MRPTDTTRALLTPEPPYREASGLTCQASVQPRYETIPPIYGVLLIGSNSTIEKPIIGLRELRSIQAHIYSSYAMPSDTLLAQVGVVFVYDIEEDRRFQQLRRCCEYQRKHGGIQSIFGILSSLNVELAERVTDIGSQFRLLG
jgi:hypothetical protein